MATRPSLLAWRISWTEEPGGSQSVESHSIRHGWVTNTHTGLDYVQKHTWISLSSQPTCQSNLCGQSQVTTHTAEAASLKNSLSCFCIDFWRDLNASHSPFPKKVRHLSKFQPFGLCFSTFCFSEDQWLCWEGKTEKRETVCVLCVHPSFIASVLLKAVNLPSFFWGHWQTTILA